MPDNLHKMLSEATEPQPLAGSEPREAPLAVPQQQQQAPAAEVPFQAARQTQEELRRIIPGELAAEMELAGLGPKPPEKVIPGALAADLEQNKYRQGNSELPQKVIPGGLMADLLLNGHPPTAIPQPMPVPEEEEESEEGLLGRIIRGFSYVPRQSFVSLQQLGSLPFSLAGIAEGVVTGETTGELQRIAKQMHRAQAYFRQPMLEDRDPEQSRLSKLVDPSIVIPGIVDFGIQLGMAGIAGGAAKATVGKYITSQYARNALATGAGALYAGNIEGSHTYYEALERGMPQSEALGAFAKHASLSGTLSVPQVGFFFTKLPGPLQQGITRRIAAGATDAVTESLDEVAGAYALGDLENWEQGLNIFADAFSEIGTAGFIVGMATGGIGAPPVRELQGRAPTASEVESQIDLGVLGDHEHDGAFSGVGEDVLRHVLNTEADYIKTKDRTIFTKTGKYRGAVVDGVDGPYWVSGQHAEDGVSVPVEDILEAGRIDDNQLPVPIITAEIMQDLYRQAERVEREVLGEDFGFFLRSDHGPRSRELETERQKRNALRARRQAGLNVQAAEFERQVAGEEAPTMRDVRRRRPQVGDEIAGLEQAVKRGDPVDAEKQPQEVPTRTSDIMIERVMAIEKEKAKTPSSVPSVQKAQRDYLRGQELTASRMQKQVRPSLEPSAEGSVAETVEQGAAAAALGEEVMTMEELMASEEVVRRMDDRINKNATSVQSASGAKFPIRVPVAPPIKTTPMEPATSASSESDFQGATLSDLQSALLRFSGSEEVMTNLMKDRLSAEDVMMKLFKDAGKLSFVSTDNGKSMTAVKPEGMSDVEYQAALSAYVTNLRRLKMVLHYTMEATQASKDGFNMELKDLKEPKPKKGKKGKSSKPSPFYSEGPSRSHTAKDSAEMGAGFVATLRHTNVYHSFVRAAQELGWMNPFVAADEASQMTYAMAHAWSGQTGQPVAEWYDEHLGDIEAFAVEMTKAKLQEFEATRGFAIPKEMLFQEEGVELSPGQTAEYEAFLEAFPENSEREVLRVYTKALADKEKPGVDASIEDLVRIRLETQNEKLYWKSVNDFLAGLPTRDQHIIRGIAVKKEGMEKVRPRAAAEEVEARSPFHARGRTYGNDPEVVRAATERLRRRQYFALEKKLKELKDFDSKEATELKIQLANMRRTLFSFAEHHFNVEKDVLGADRLLNALNAMEVPVSKYSKEALQRRFNLTDRQAEALEAIVLASPIKPEKLLVGVDHSEFTGSTFLFGSATHTKDNVGVIRGTEMADVETALHELVHVFQRLLFNPNVSKEERGGMTNEDIVSIGNWAGVSAEELSANRWPTAAQEKFANAMVGYILHGGKAPTPELRRAFKEIRRWMSEAQLYSGVSILQSSKQAYPVGRDGQRDVSRQRERGERVAEDLSPNVKKVFDKILDQRLREGEKLFSRSSASNAIYGTYDLNTKNIQFFLGSDLHTALHEMGHAFLQSLPEAAVKDLEKWVYQGRKRPKKGEQWDRNAHEKFANAFVAWASGKAGHVPKELEKTFDRIGAYMTELYATGRALQPATKVHPQLAETMEKLITRQLRRSVDAEDNEEAKEREKVRREFLGSKPLVNLGDHVEAISEFLGIDKENFSVAPDIRAEVESRKKQKGYVKELRDKLAASEGTGKYAIDIVDFVIVRDEAVEIRKKFEEEFRVAYNDGPTAVRDLARRWHKRKAFVDLGNYMGVAGDVGRKLSLLTNKSIMADHALVLDETQKRYGSKGFDILFQMVKDPENAHKIADSLAKEQAPGMMDLFTQLMFGNFLSSPTTLGINFFFTGIWTAWHYGVHSPIAAQSDRLMFGMSKVPLMGKLVDKFYFQGDTAKRDRFVASLLPVYAGLSHSIPEGLRHAGNILRNPNAGLHEFEQIKGMDLVAKDVNSWSKFTILRDSPIGKALVKNLGKEKGEKARIKLQNTVRTLNPAVSLPTNLMRASDLIFKTVAVEARLNQLVQETATLAHPNDKRAQKQYFHETMKTMTKDMTAIPESWKQELVNAANYTTFMDKPGTVSRHVLAIRENLPLSKVVVPFFNTLVNIGKRGLEMTPGVGIGLEALYLQDKQFEKGRFGHRREDIIAKQIEGSIMAAVILLMMDEDKMTGEIPEDPTERALFTQSGKIPNAFDIGGNWVSFEYLDPFSVPLRILVNLRKHILENTDEFSDPSPEVRERAIRDLTNAGWAIGSLGLNIGFLRTFTDYAEAQTHKQKLRALGRTGEGVLVPYSGLVRWLMRRTDMVQDENGQFVPRQQTTLADQTLPITHNMINDLFGMPRTDLPRLTVFGEPYSWSDNKWYEVWWPAYYSEGSDDPVDLELERLQYAVGFPDKTYEIGPNKYEYSPDIWQQMVLGFGQESKPLLRRRILSAGYQQAPDHIKHKILQDITSMVREKYRNRARHEQHKRGLIRVN